MRKYGKKVKRSVKKFELDVLGTCVYHKLGKVV